MADSTNNLSGTPLTMAQLKELREGTAIIVTWSGGNGPHEYTLTFDHYGYPYAWSKHGVPSDEHMRFHNPFNSVGEHPMTQVWVKP